MAALKEALKAQIAADDPPETRLTLARLLREGIPEDEAWRWLSAVMLQEMSLIISDNRPFDREGYIAALHRLPELRDR
jgi:hypothetical protein